MGFASFITGLQDRSFFRLINPYSLYQIAYQLVYLFSSFICLRWVLPEDIGVWTTMVMIESYMMITRFGVFNAFNREFPFYLGKGENPKALKFLYTTEWFAICLGGLFFIGLPFSLLFYDPVDQPLWRISILALSCVVPLNIYRNFLDLTYRTSRDFALLAKVQLRLIITVLFSILLVYWFGYRGYLLRFVFLGVVALVLYFYFRAQPFNPKLNKLDFKYLFFEGLPLFTSNYLQKIVNEFPKTILLFFGGYGLLGLYNPVHAILSLGILIPSSISMYLLPHLNFEFGKNESKEFIIANGLRAALYSMMIMVPILIGLWIIIPVMISWLLPNFIDSILPMRLALILSLLAAFKVSFNVFTVLKAWNRMYVYLLGLVIIQLTIPLCFVNIFSDYNLLVTIVGSLIVAEIIMIFISIYTIKTIQI